MSRPSFTLPVQLYIFHLLPNFRQCELPTATPLQRREFSASPILSAAYRRHRSSPSDYAGSLWLFLWPSDLNLNLIVLLGRQLLSPVIAVGRHPESSSDSVYITSFREAPCKNYVVIDVCDLRWRKSPLTMEKALKVASGGQ